MVRYSVRAAKALGFLKKAYNDIEIFVEDRTCHHMYVLFFRTILPGGVRLTSVNQVGDRRSVMEACRRDQVEDGRKKLYLIDGDFDHYHRRHRPRLRYLYRLRGYCIENILINERAAVAVAAQADTNTPEATIIARLDFRNWIARVMQKLRSLFVVYAVAEGLRAGIATVSFSVARLLQRRSLSEKKIARRIRTVARAVCKVRGFNVYKKERQRIEANLRDLRITFDRLIPGKDYLLPLLKARIQDLFRYRGNADQLRTQLAANYDPDLEPWLRRRLLGIVAST
jgi:hypothetical protein